MRGAKVGLARPRYFYIALIMNEKFYHRKMLRRSNDFPLQSNRKQYCTHRHVSNKQNCIQVIGVITC